MIKAFKHSKFLTIYTLLIFFSFSSCKKMLEEVPQNKLYPVSTKDFEELLNYGYIKNQIMPYIDILTDDVNFLESDIVNDGGVDGSKLLLGAYLWKSSHEETMQGGDKAFSELYRSIYYSNLVIDKIDGASGIIMNEDEVRQTKLNIKAQAYALRAYCYFYLINLYAKPYNSKTAATDPGVPINLSVDVKDQQYPRSTISEVYSLISNDMDSALNLFKQTTIQDTVKFKFNLQSTLALETRIALYLQDWEKVVTNANKLLETNSILFDLRKYTSLNQVNNSGTGWSSSSIIGTDYLGINNDNILFVSGLSEVMPALSMWPYITTFSVNPELKNVFEMRDLRRYYFMQTFIRNTPTGLKTKLTFAKNRYAGFGFSAATYPGYSRVLRIEEVYMNRAEAFANLNQIENSVKDLNTVRKLKFDPSAYVDLSPAAFTKDSLLNFIYQERRREFCFEGLRWFDLRRTNQPAMSRLPYKGAIATLQHNDLKYVLQIPMKELSINPLIGQAPR